MPASSPTPQSNRTPVEARLDEILEIMHRMDSRDKWRNVGGFFRGIVTLIPIVVLLGSIWYFSMHGADIMKMVADQAAQAATKYTQQSSEGLLDQLMKEYAVPQQ